MKNIFIAAILFLSWTILPHSIFADQGDIGVGLIVGEPTGLSMKIWTSNEHAVDLAAAWSFSDNDSFQFHGDYLVHRFNIFENQNMKGKLPIYYGIGARLKLEDEDDNGRNNDDNLFGIRVPIGISYIFAQEPIDLFAEIVPVMDIAPDTDFDINVAIGGRFYFK